MPKHFVECPRQRQLLPAPWAESATSSPRPPKPPPSKPTQSTKDDLAALPFWLWGPAFSYAVVRLPLPSVRGSTTRKINWARLEISISWPVWNYTYTMAWTAWINQVPKVAQCVHVTSEEHFLSICLDHIYNSLINASLVEEPEVFFQRSPLGPSTIFLGIP